MTSLRSFSLIILSEIVAGTMISLVIGTIVGGATGWLIGLVTRRKQAVLIPAILGSSLGVLIVAILPTLAQASSVLSGTGYAAIYLQVLLFLLIPLGSLSGGILGSIFGLIFSSRLRPRGIWISFFAIYFILLLSFYLTGITSPAPAKPQDELAVVRTIPYYKAYLCCMAFTADGQQLAIANSGNVHILQVDSGKLLHSFEGQPRIKMNIEEEDIRSIALTPDGKLLATAAEQTIKVIDVETGKLLHQFKGGQNVRFTPDGRAIVGFAETKDKQPNVSVQIWDVNSGELCYTIPVERSGIRHAIFDITPDSKTLIISPTPLSNRIELWDLTTGQRLQTWAGDQQQEIATLAVTPDGKTVVIALNDSLQFLNLSNGQVTKTIKNLGYVFMLQMDTMGEKLLSYGGQLTLWQLPTGNRMKTWRIGIGAADRPVELSPKGTLLATYTTEGDVKLLHLP